MLSLVGVMAQTLNMYAHTHTHTYVHQKPFLNTSDLSSETKVRPKMNFYLCSR